MLWQAAARRIYSHALGRRDHRRERMRRLGILFLMAMAAAGICAGQEAKKAAPTTVAIRAGKILDVRTGNYLKDQIIWIEGDKIKAIGNAAEIEKQLPAGAKRIDLARATALPGLIDCHTHLTGSPYLLGPAGFHSSYPREALLGARHARLTLEAGFT